MNAPTTTSDEVLGYDVGQGEQATDVALSNEPPAVTSETFVENAAAAAPASASASPTADELDVVSESVKRRIAKLTARMRESERREQAALAYAQGLQRQATELQQRLVYTDAGRLNEAKSRIDTQLATLKSIIKRAREENDIETETEAAQQLTKLTLEQQQVAAYMPPAQAAMPAQQAMPQQAMPQQAYVQPSAQPRPQRRSDPKADAWASRNTWFGSDQQMTYAAFSVHKALIDEEGFDPQSDEYYTELDRRIRTQFPNRFNDAPQTSERPPAYTQTRAQSNAPAVLPATRSSGVNAARKVVRLTPSEVAIAKKLGVPLEEYAKYVKR